MKRIPILVCAVLLSLFKANAQEPQLVSTEPSNRNVFIEEFTGRECGWCPVGQKVINEIIDANPGRIFTANIHSEGDLSPTTYPNLNTLKGADIAKAFWNGGLPTALINRTTEKSVGRGEWPSMVNQQLAQPAECNIAGQVSINPNTRLARMTVEVYYTANSSSETNYVTIVMLQDDIIGEQSGAEQNPEQVVGDKYRHMHVYRNTITTSSGDEISPTTAGTLIKKTFKYSIPQSIGEPNGVAVDLDKVHFIAYVTEKRGNGVFTMPVLNVCELELVDETTPVEEVDESLFSIYPNPVENEIYVETVEAVEELTVYNISGQQIMLNMQQISDGFVIDASNLTSGVYFIRVNDKIQKFIKQ